MKKINILALVCFISFQMYAQAPAIVLKTSKSAGEPIELRLVAGRNVMIDWGTGDKVEVEVSKNFGKPSTHSQILAVNAAEIKIYGYNITFLRCDNNALTELDVTNAKFLRVLQCQRNKLTELDVTNNEALRTLWCGSNQIKALDVSQNVELTQLSCMTNKIQELNVSQNTQLNTLICAVNNLKTLDLSNNVALRALDCRNTGLTELDLSKNPEIANVSIHNDGPTFANNFSACALNALFRTLPVRNGKINIINSLYTGRTNNDAEGSNKTIASNKGWIVSDVNGKKEITGDGKGCN